MPYLDPKNDLTFKKVFGEHPHLLKSFLSALLPLEEGKLEGVDLSIQIVSYTKKTHPYLKLRISSLQMKQSYDRS